MKTKTFFAMIVIAAISSLTMSTFAQTTSTVVVDTLYTGVLAGPIYNTQNNTTTTAANIRGGVQATWKASSQLSLRSAAVVEYDASIKNWLVVNSFYGVYAPSEKITMTAGFGPTLPAKYHRPHPATASGHFETFTTAQLPGGAEHVQMQYTSSHNLLFAAGISLFQKQPMYATTIGNGMWKGTAYYTSSNDAFGGAVTYAGTHLQTTLVVKQDAMVANVVTYSFGKKNEFVFYADNGYDTSLKEMVRTEAGFLRTFTGTDGRWGGLFGLGYDNINKAVKSYLFVTLQN